MLIINRDTNDTNAIKHMLERYFGMEIIGVVNEMLDIRILRTP